MLWMAIKVWVKYAFQSILAPFRCILLDMLLLFFPYFRRHSRGHRCRRLLVWPSYSLWESQVQKQKKISTEIGQDKGLGSERNAYIDIRK